MDYLRVKANKGGYWEKDTSSKNQFINGITHDVIIGVIKKLKAIKKTNEVTSEKVLVQVRRVEEHRAQKPLIEATNKNKDFTPQTIVKTIH